MSSREVQVLLAAYNGERFLREQIDSILGQSYPALRILAGDDGSLDGSAAILADYARLYPDRFEVLAAGLPMRSAKGNFLRLLQHANGPYLAFADQDDVWLPDKIEREMAAMEELERLHGVDAPLLVFTDLRVVEESLAVRHPSLWAHEGIDPRGVHRLRNLLIQNVVTGCTALLNRPLGLLARRMPIQVASMHDWWVALLACSFGDAAFLREPSILYRQHGNNTLGASSEPRPSGMPGWRAHDQRRAQWEASVRQAAGLLKVHGGELPVRQRALIETYLRCETSPNRMIRVGNLLRGRFFQKGLRRNLAMLWYLWDMEAAKQPRHREG